MSKRYLVAFVGKLEKVISVMGNDKSLKEAIKICDLHNKFANKEIGSFKVFPILKSVYPKRLK